jgi:hypothetical protein
MIKGVFTSVVAALLFSSVAVAQFNGCSAGFCSPSSASASYTGPGDIVSGAYAWYGLRAYNAAIAAAGTQKLINIRNGTTTETCDVIVASNGGLGLTANCSGSSNGESPATFCSGATCSVVTAYDQSGANNCSGAPCNATQATTGQQPTLNLSCVNSLPCVVFSAASTQYLRSGTVTTQAVPYSASSVSMRTGAFTAFGDVQGGAGGNIIIGYANVTGEAELYLNNASLKPAAANSVWHSIQIVANSTSSISVDGAAATTGGVGTQSIQTTIDIGDDGSLGSLFTGDWVENGWWPSSISTGNFTTMCENQQARYGAGNFGATC